MRNSTLRNPEHAKRLELELASLPAEVLKGLLAAAPAKNPGLVEPVKGRKGE